VTWTLPAVISSPHGQVTILDPIVEDNGTTILFQVNAITATGTMTYAFTSDGNPGSIATDTIPDTGEVTLALTLDYETAQSHVFKIV